MSVVKNLNLKVDENLLHENPDFVEDPVLRAVKHYENQTSIKKEIKRNVDKRNFSLSFAFFTDNKQQLKNLNPKKASQDTDIPPTRILKENSAQFVLKNNNEVINTSTIPNILEYANVKPGYERDSRNYRPMSILSNLFKCMTSVCLMKWHHTLTIFCQTINVDSKKDSALSSAYSDNSDNTPYGTSSKTNLACEKLLGVILDDNLNLKSHISNLCKKASNKLNAFARISSFIYLPKCRVIMKTSLIHNFVSVR